ncbi:M15 family metallopeptidase [Weissella kandleri]|nr:M15 family metallopeptidase [Weissella kandleri]
MNNKRLIPILTLIIFLGVLAGVFTHMKNNHNPDAHTSKSKSQVKNAITNSSHKTKITPELMVVNKKHPLTSDYNPYNGSTTDNNPSGSGLSPATNQAKTALIQAMQKAGFKISENVSGYRSYRYQTILYQNYVQQHGQAEADTFSARPGYSEHQSGLAFDLIGANGDLPTDDQMYQWLQNHAHNFGLIIRFPRGSNASTGYMGEEWHMRYVGKANATKMHQQHIATLEEFTGLPGGDYNQDSKQDIPAISEID